MKIPEAVQQTQKTRDCTTQAPLILGVNYTSGTDPVTPLILGVNYTSGTCPVTPLILGVNDTSGTCPVTPLEISHEKRSKYDYD